MSSSIEVQWDDPNKVLAGLQRMLAGRGIAIRQVPERAVRRGTFELLKILKSPDGPTPIGQYPGTDRRGGTLIRSINAAVKKISADLVEGKVGTWIEYARYVEDGTGIYGPRKRPITIVAKNKKALFWGAYNDKGKPIAAKRVLVKGMEPRKPFEKAMAKFLPVYLEIIREELLRT